MFLRSNNRKKDGKDHRYFSVVENQRVASGKTVQRTVLYLGEINDQQQAAWRKTLSVFDKQQQEYENLCLFPDDREIPADAVDALQVKLSGLELRSPRMFGNCWLACELWRQLGLASKTELRKTLRFKELSMPELKQTFSLRFTLVTAPLKRLRARSPLWEIAVRLAFSAGCVSGSPDTRPKSSDFGRGKLTKIEFTESVTYAERKSGVFGRVTDFWQSKICSN